MSGLNRGAVTPKGQNLIPASGTTTTLGLIELLVAPVGKRLRIHYFSYNPETGPASIGFQVGTTAPGATRILYNTVTANAVVAKDFAKDFIENGVGESLYLVVSAGAALNVNWNVLYTLE